MAENADMPLASALTEARAIVHNAVKNAEEKRLIGLMLSEIDRVIARLDPTAGASFELTSMVASVPPREAEIETLRREIERLSAMARDERGLLDAILNHSPHGIMVSDLQGKLTLQNRASERIWAGSVTADNVAAWGQYRAFHSDGRPYEPHDWAMARCLTRGETISAEEVHFQRFDGTHGILLGSCAPILSPEGKIRGALGVFADITEFKQLEAKLRVSEAWLATVLKGIGDAVIVADTTGRIEFMNDRAEMLTGWSVSDAKGLPLGEVYRIVDAQTRAALESPVTKMLHSKTAVGSSDGALLLRKDKAELAIDDSEAPIRNAKGELIGIVLVFRDVTARRRAEERRQFISEVRHKLVSSGLDYDATLAIVAGLAVPHLADVAIVDIFDPEDAVVRLAAVHSTPSQASVVETLRRSYPSEPDVPHAVHAAMQQDQLILWPDLTERGWQSPPGPSEIGRRFGPALRPYVDAPAYAELLRELGVGSAIIVPLRAHSRTCGALTLLSSRGRHTYDLDDLTLAEELSSLAALAVYNAQVYREAQRLNQAKDDFLATLSHELRTPLTAILGWTRMLRMGLIKPEVQARALEAIERNATLQTQLVEDLLDASRIITGKLRLDVVPLELPPVINAALDAVRHMAETKAIEIQSLLDPAAGPISGDPTRLQQVVTNLLSNAIKFTPRGGKVSIALSRIGNVARISVSDNGQGIAPDFLPEVFDRFRQADSTSTRPHSGLGLGLAIARHLVELHGGTVHAESQGEGKGSTFTVDLRVELKPGALRTAYAVAAAPKAEPGLHELRILVVDDEEDARELIRAILEQKGAVVTVLATAAEALVAIEQSQPDVILSDIGMPDEDGYSLIRKLRARRPEQGGSIPAVALTAYASAQDRTDALRAGFQSHIPKPIDVAELTEVIASLTRRAVQR